MKLQVLIDKKFEGNIKNSKPHIRGVFCLCFKKLQYNVCPSYISHPTPLVFRLWVRNFVELMDFVLIRSVRDSVVHLSI